MTKIISTLLLCFSFLCIQAQDSDVFTRKGRILIEPGGGLFSIINKGSDFNFYFADGESITSFSVDGGYFLSENFALRGRLGVLAVEGSSLLNLNVGGRYYIAKKVPVQAGVGILAADGTTAIFDLGVGYGIKLARNINLEPNINLYGGPDIGPLINLGFRFALFL